MTWLRLDDTMDEDEGIMLLSDKARWIYVRALLFCARKNTDGHVGNGKASELDPRGKLWAEIVSRDLAERTDTGYYFDRFLKYNPSKAEVEAKRESDRKRKERWRSERSPAVGHAVTDDVTSERVRSPRPDPTRPDPVLGFKTLESPSVLGESEGGHPALGGWEMTPDMAALLASLPAEMGTELMPSLAQASGRFGNAASVEALRRVRSAVDVGTPIANPGGFLWHHAEAVHIQLLGEVSQ